MSTLLFNSEDILIVNPHLAKLIGLNEAIVLQQIHYWVNNKGCAGVQANGRKWVYNTVSQWQEQFPFFSPSTIKRTMIELRNLGLISIEQLSENGRDKTNYYSINYEKLYSLQTGQFEPSRQVNLNRLDRSNWSHPNRTETTTENKEKTEDKPRASLAGEFGEKFQKFWSAYPRKIGKDAAQKAFNKRKPDDKLLGEMLKAIEVQKTTEDWRKSDGQFIPHPATWLNQGRWMDEVAGMTKAIGKTSFLGAI